MDRFTKDFEKLNRLHDNSKTTFVIDMIKNMGKKPYMASVFYYLNKNTDKFHDTLDNIFSYIDNPTRRYILMKYLLNSSINTSVLTRYTLNTSLIKTKAFQEDFKLFNIHISNSSKEEQMYGPFSGIMRWAHWTDYFKSIEAIKPLLDNEKCHQSLLTYVENITKYNVAYVELDPAKINQSCSGDDFNIFMLLIVINLYEKTKSNPNLDTVDRYNEVLGRAFNVMFISKVAVKRRLLTDIKKYSDPNAQKSIKTGLDRLNDIYNKSIFNRFVAKNIGEVVQDITCVNELNNFIRYLCDKNEKFFKNYELGQLIGDCIDVISISDIEYNHESVILLLYAIGATNVFDKIDTSSKEFLLKMIKRSMIVKPDMFTMATNVIEYTGSSIHCIFDTMCKTFIELDYTRNNFETYTNIITSIHHMTHDMSKNYVNYTFQYMKSLDATQGNNRFKVETINTFISTFVKKCSCDTTLDTKKKMIDMFSMCELEQFNITTLKLRLMDYDKTLADKLDESLSFKERTSDKIYDHLFKNKKIKSPIFIPDMSNVIIDKTSLETPEFDALIKNKTTIEDVKRFNSRLDIINRKFYFIAMLNVHNNTSTP